MFLRKAGVERDPGHLSRGMCRGFGDPTLEWLWSPVSHVVMSSRVNAHPGVMDLRTPCCPTWAWGGPPCTGIPSSGHRSGGLYGGVGGPDLEWYRFPRSCLVPWAAQAPRLGVRDLRETLLSNFGPRGIPALGSRAPSRSRVWRGCGPQPGVVSLPTLTYDPWVYPGHPPWTENPPGHPAAQQEADGAPWPRIPGTIPETRLAT